MNFEPKPEYREEKRKQEYALLEREMEEMRSRMKADEEVLEYYKEKETAAIERLLGEIRLRLDEAEKQIRLLIEARQQKTMQVEEEIKETSRRQ
ncbi:MAG: hypothetical protein Q4A78_02660 [Peptostreptococcaceae bacterium]|nr:hypothetical protein [Peptostreptococcaceae bacterium]